MPTFKQLKLSRLSRQERESLIPKFREGSKTEKLAFMLVDKGLDGWLTYDEMAKELYNKKTENMDLYEKILVYASIRGMIRDVRYKFGVFIERIFIPKIEDFAYKVVMSAKEFDEVIDRVQQRIDTLTSYRNELKENRDNPKYREQVRVFFNEVFK